MTATAIKIGRTPGVYRPLSVWHVVLAALAIANLSAGVWISLQPGAGSDLRSIAKWAASLTSGEDPYAPPTSVVDYPPWALVILWPLTLVPGGWRQLVWVIVNVGLAVELVRRLIGLVDEPPPVRLRLGLVVAAAACLRSFSQFSLLSYVLAIGGALSTSTMMSSALLGLSLIKPQIGGVVAVWMLLTGRWRRVLLALTVPLALTVVFARVVGVDSGTLIAEYTHVAARVYSIPASFAGHTELRAWLWTVWPDMVGNYALTVVVATILFVPAVWAVLRRRPTGEPRALELLALCGVVSLLSWRHLSSDFILLLPAVVAWRVPPFSSRLHAPRWMFFGLTVLLVAGLPGWIRWTMAHGAPGAIEVVTEADRLLALAMWAALVWRLHRRDGRSDRAT